MEKINERIVILSEITVIFDNTQPHNNLSWLFQSSKKLFEIYPKATSIVFDFKHVQDLGKVTVAFFRELTEFYNICKEKNIKISFARTSEEFLHLLNTVGGFKK